MRAIAIMLLTALAPSVASAQLPSTPGQMPGTLPPAPPVYVAPPPVAPRPVPSVVTPLPQPSYGIPPGITRAPTYGITPTVRMTPRKQRYHRPKPKLANPG